VGEEEETIVNSRLRDQPIIKRFFFKSLESEIADAVELAAELVELAAEEALEEEKGTKGANRKCIDLALIY